jgi:hypothetical protein
MSYAPPKKNTAYVFFVGLRSQADTKLFQVNPTLAAGDFKVSIDGGALTNLTTLPTVTPAAGRMVKISLSAAEMNGDNITVVAADAAGAEWCDDLFKLQTEIDGTVAQSIGLGLKTDLRTKMEALEKSMDVKFEKVRIAVLDLAQAILRGKK